MRSRARAMRARTRIAYIYTIVVFVHAAAGRRQSDARHLFSLVVGYPGQSAEMNADVTEEGSKTALPCSIRVVDGCAVAEAAAIVRASEVPVLFRGT